MGNENSRLVEEYHARMYSRSENFSGQALNNFACVALSLKHTVEVAHDFVEQKMKTEYNSWSPKLKADFNSFCDKASRDKDFVRFTTSRKRQLGERAWNLCVPNACYETVLKAVMLLHTYPMSRNFQWSSNSNRLTEPYWILAKMFMPHGNQKSTDINDTDALSVLCLLQNCRLFKDEFDVEVIDKLCEARQAVMRLLSTEISDGKKNEFLDAMIDFVETSCLSQARTKDVMLRALTRLKSGDVIVCNGYYHLEQRIRLILPPGSDISEEELQESLNSAVDTSISNLKKRVNEYSLEANTAINKEIDERKKKEEELLRFKRIGGAAGAAATGSAAGVSLGVVAGGIALTAGGAVLAPVAIVGGAAAVIGCLFGYSGGWAGGSVMKDVLNVK